jgi:ABC-type transport system involved in multi-copper enzyme maturation permease subunit
MSISWNPSTGSRGNYERHGTGRRNVLKALSVLWSIARYEILLIVRSWPFRIFSVLALSVATLVTVAVALPRDVTFFFNRAMSGAFPLLAIKLFNVFLGLISVFLATEFLKRDRKQDTSQVYYIHSFSNATYVLGKFLGIFTLIFLLNVLVLVVTGIIHIFFSRTPFAWQPYLLYVLFVSLPTVMFMVGLSIFLGSLIRNQAVVYLIALVYTFFVLVVVGQSAFFAFDSFAYYAPVMFSDFIGLGNLADLLLLRGAYFVLGLALILGSTLLMKRLRQSSWLHRAATVLSIGLVIVAAVLFTVYVREKTAAQAFRAGLKAQSIEPASRPAMTLTACDIRLKPNGRTISAEADLILTNRTESPIETILLTLNPGLKVGRLQGPAGPLAFEQKNHIITIHPGASIGPGNEIKLSLSYAGEIDERYCYLDIGDARYWSPLRFWLIAVPKRYAVVTDSFIHLSPESGWYPRPGLPPALLFPKTVKQDFTKYSLAVTLPAGLTAVSQGASSESDAGRYKIFKFQPENPLPQVSLTVGRYERKSVTVDGTDYSLYTLAGHDRTTPLLSEIKGDLPAIIKQVKNEYEVLLGLSYPYKRFTLVELPIQITSYNRLWNTAQEQVQPEIVYLPEMGALCTGADFHSAQRMVLGPAAGRAGGTGAASGATSNRGGQAGRAGAAGGSRGQAASITPKDLQRALLSRFIRSNLTEQTMAMNIQFRAGLLGIQFETNSEPRYGIFPQFVTYATHFAAPEWPLFDYVMDAYLRGRVSVTAGPGLRLAQTSSVQEEISKIMADHSLAELLGDSSRERWPLSSILEAKSKQFLALIQSKLGQKDFDAKLTEWLKGLRFQAVPKAAAAEFFKGLGELDLDRLFASWSSEKGIPGFVFDNLESYRVVEKEKQRAQLKFQVTNPTDTDGVIKIEYITRGAAGGRMGGGGGAVGGMIIGGVGGGAGGGIMVVGGGGAAAERRYFVVPARTAKEIGLVLDQPAVTTTIDTYISRNLPASFLLPFLTTPAQPGAVAFDGEIDHPLDQAQAGAAAEYIVDDEDPGFSVPAGDRENWLRRFIRKTFPTSGAEESDYAQFRDILNPPGQWTPVIMQNFYGRFVRSSYLKRAGNGQSRVGWTADIRETGDYDISFYYSNIFGGVAVGGMRGGEMMGGARGAGMGGARGGFGGGPGMGQRGQTGGPPQMGQRGGQQPGGGRGPAFLQPGKKHFIIHSEDGVEDVVIDLKDAQPGWNVIGTFRLAAGPNKIEMTDRNDTVYVLADAVKWAKHKL